MIWDMVMIMVMTVFIVDVSGFVESVKRTVWSWLYPNRVYRDFELKPFTCSLCMTWWLCLLYLVITGNLTLFSTFIALGLSYLSPVVYQLLMKIRLLLSTLVGCLPPNDDLYF